MKFSAAVYHRSVRLGESELETEREACGFCGAREFEIVASLQEDPRVELRRCRGCRCGYASRMPTPDALERYYGTYYGDSSDESRSSSVTHGDSARFARHVVALAERRGPGGLPAHGDTVRILDFGGGDGSLGASLAEIVLGQGPRAVEVVVVDYCPDLVAPPAPGITIRKATAPEGQGTFDWVLASAVLEHLPEPRPTLSSLLAATKPGGWFYARTPWVEPFVRLFAAVGREFDFTYPAHLYDLGADFWDAAATWPEFSDFECHHAGPSIVETTFRDHPARTVASHLAKAPHRILGRRWPFVGGWEVLTRRSGGGRSES